MCDLHTVTAFSALGSAIFAAISACQAKKSAKQTNKIAQRNERNELDKRLDDILKIAIQYPYLESKAFTKQWDMYKGSDDIRYIRYDSFCNLIFNFIHKVYETYDKDKSQVENYIDVKNWIYLHENNWKNPIDPHENIEGYDEEFRKFINSYLM
ncbi:hypothetical protein LJC25_04285 [Bacteroidales bacterium OttesenSCG-928-K03]|nr:hypothetical protein [Odoribacter sp. OttesenSCG-928-L07]MDL2242929.1 hypothetical protein [Bacteroidales bacterium OttesenSCG-928-K03]